MKINQLVYALLLAGVAAVRLPAQTVQTLCSFNGSNGENPTAALTLGNDGNFYGTTSAGGGSGEGTVFKVTTNGVLTPLASFSGKTFGNPGTALTLGTDGNFYGTTGSGVSNFNGGVFMVTTNGVLTPLVSFSGGRNGALPYAALTLDNDGNFYGTTTSGGDTGLTGTSPGNGTVFKVTTNGVLTPLFFCSSGGGVEPQAALTLGTDGNFYGTTTSGGNINLVGGGVGTVFGMTTNGTLTMVVAFDNTNGAVPQAALTLGNDGNFYGTTTSGGDSGYGTVFKVTTNGVLTRLVSFSGGTNGANPYASLTLCSDGNFYGTTTGIGSGYGTVFKVTTNGVLTTLVSFSGGTNGAYPYASLTLGTDGKFYGTTKQGGSSGYGTVFRLLLPQQLTIIFSAANVILTWPTNVAGFTLQSTTNLALTDWNTNLISPVVVNGQNAVTNPVSGTQMFFRLSQ